jgi:Carboxypeptidase regulatory-like domain
MRRLALLLVCGSAIILGLLGPVRAEAATGYVEGTVTPIESAPEVEVCVVESQPSEICAAPAADGAYVLREVPFGGARIEFVPSFRSRLLRQYYDEVGKLSEARTVVLSALEPTAKGIDADLLEGGAIEGIVTAAGGGAPLSQVEVCAVSVGSPTVKSCGETDAGGEYELHSLTNGTYRVEFLGAGPSAEYQPSSHPAVGVAAGQTTTNVNGSLAKGGRIGGTVSAAGGGRLAGVPVCLFAAAPAPQRCVTSGDGGEYSFAGLPGGSYQVGFSLDPAELGWQGGFAEDGFESQYYDGVRSRAEAATIPLIAPAAVGGIDASLSAPSVLPPPAPAPLVASAIVAAPPTIAVPAPKKATCKKGYRKKKVKGKVRCVKPATHKPKKPSKKKHKSSHGVGDKKR